MHVFFTCRLNSARFVCSGYSHQPCVTVSFFHAKSNASCLVALLHLVDCTVSRRVAHITSVRTGTGAGLQKMWRVDRTFFLRSEPGTGASLQKMWRVDRTFFLRSEPGTGASLQKMWRVDRTFFLRSEPGTGASLQKMWRVDRTFFLRSEPGTGASLQKMWRVDRTFFCGLNLEQVLAYRKCGER